MPGRPPMPACAPVSKPKRTTLRAASMRACSKPSSRTPPAGGRQSTCSTGAPYAAGAAAILFSVEHDEHTFDFLRGLPATSAPAFISKMVTALLNSLALAATLALIAWVCSGQFATAQDSQTALGVFGYGIFEAVAWGTLFSLLLKRPLVAATRSASAASAASST